MRWKRRRHKKEDGGRREKDPCHELVCNSSSSLTSPARALPLAFESDLPLSHFPPFNRKPRKEKDEKTT